MPDADIIETEAEKTDLSFESEIADIKNSVPVVTSQDKTSDKTISTEPEGEKRGRGRPKGSKNKVTFEKSGSIPSGSITPSTINTTTETMQKISPAMAQGFIGLLDGMFIVMHLEKVTPEEKSGFIEIWSNVELPFSTENKFMKYLPLVGAVVFTIGLLMPRLSKMKEKRQQEQKKVEEKKKALEQIPQTSQVDNAQPKEQEPEIPSANVGIASIAGVSQ